MKLSKIIKNMNCKEIINYNDCNIDCLTHNSQDIIENSVFFCISGKNNDGHKYVAEAVSKGATVVVTDRRLDISATIIVVDDVRRTMSVMARNFYGRADENLQKVAIVGTNGKTTTSFVLANIMKHSGKKVGVIGTNGVYIDGEYLPNNLTTPDPIELHYIFSQMVYFGIEVVIMEVSAHAIYYDKVYGIKFDVGVFTNISNEHLDFFQTMENYAKVKISLFNRQIIRECVVNIDDEYGVKIAKSSSSQVVSYGIYNPANIFAVDVKISMKGMRFFVNINDEIMEVNTSLIGEYNVYNILASIGVAKLLGVDNATIAKALSHQSAVDGRFMVYDIGANKRIIIDFAHTPDGFEKVLSLVKRLRTGKITCLFGCVGYSDRNKRIAMGEVASKYADELIISTDNIDDANFDTICNDICTNVPDIKVVAKIEDRTQAIQYAYSRMGKNDTLVILGKGCEKKQVVNGKWQEYSDIQVVENLIQEIKSD